MEMQPTPLSDLPPAPLTDQLMQPTPLPDTLFASPETWISSLPSMSAFFKSTNTPSSRTTYPKQAPVGPVSLFRRNVVQLAQHKSLAEEFLKKKKKSFNRMP